MNVLGRVLLAGVSSTSGESGDLLHELILDRTIKLGIVVAAVVVVLISMIVIYKKVGTRK